MKWSAEEDRMVLNNEIPEGRNMDEIHAHITFLRLYIPCKVPTPGIRIGPEREVDANRFSDADVVSDNDEDENSPGQDEHDWAEVLFNDSMQPVFVRDGRFKRNNRNKKIYSGKCSWCGSWYLSHRSFTKHRASCVKRFGSKIACMQHKQKMDKAADLRATRQVSILSFCTGPPARSETQEMPAPASGAASGGEDHVKRAPITMPVMVKEEREIQHDVPFDRAIFAEAITEAGVGPSAVQGPAMRALLNRAKSLGASVAVDRDTVRKDVIDLGAFYQSIVRARLRHQRVTVVIDGGTRCGRILYPVLLFHVNAAGQGRMEYYKTLEFVSATADLISRDVAKIRDELSACDVNMFAACTDNGSNLRKAFAMDGQPLSVQDLCGVPLLRTPCSIHTGNLILPDARRTVPVFNEFCEWLRPTMLHLRSKPVRAVLRSGGLTQKIPVIQDGKWNTWVKSATFFRDNREMIAELLKENGMHPPDGWCAEVDEIVSALSPFKPLTERIERGSTTLSDFHSMQLDCKSAWIQLCAAGNDVAGSFLGLYEQRFTTTGDSLQNELAWVFTPEGHADYHALRIQIDMPSGEWTVDAQVIDRFAQRLPEVRAKMIQLVEHMFPAKIVGGIAERRAGLGRLFDAYVDCSDFWSDGENARSGWATKGARRAGIWEQTLRCNRSDWLDFVRIASLLTQMPASEAAAERLFSVFDCVFKKNRMSSHIELLDATLMIREWQIYHRDEIDADGAALSVQRAHLTFDRLRAVLVSQHGGRHCWPQSAGRIAVSAFWSVVHLIGDAAPARVCRSI
jgi:hypothetical protein